MLKVNQVKKQFGEKVVLKNVEFEISKNSAVALLGPNGAGKTTLMRILVGVYNSDEGEVLWDKNSIEQQKLAHKKRVGYLPENNPLYGYMTVSEYLYFICEAKSSDKTEAEVVAKECGLLEVYGNKIETLSKGYKQRVGLAAALIGDPKLLILDEPTTGLDPNQIIEIRKLIKKLSKKKIVILSTHILPEAKAVCDRILLISRGEIVLDDLTAKIKNLEKKFVQLTS